MKNWLINFIVSTVGEFKLPEIVKQVIYLTGSSNNMSSGRTYLAYLHSYLFTRRHFNLSEIFGSALNLARLSPLESLLALLYRNVSRNKSNPYRDSTLALFSSLNPAQLIFAFIYPYSLLFINSFHSVIEKSRRTFNLRPSDRSNLCHERLIGALILLKKM